MQGTHPISILSTSMAAAQWRYPANMHEESVERMLCELVNRWVILVAVAMPSPPGHIWKRRMHGLALPHEKLRARHTSSLQSRYN